MPVITAQSTAARCSKCDSCVLNHRAICRGASPEAVIELNRIGHIRSFTRGQIVQGQGEKSVIVGNIIDGVIKLSTANVEGDHHIVGLLFPSDFFGRVYAEESKFSYEAATDVTLCCMDRQAFERFLGKHPEVEHELLISKLDELDAMREWSSMITGHTTMQRVATFLYVLAKRSENASCDVHAPKTKVFTIPISRRDIAAYLGTTPETLSRNVQAISRRKICRIINAKTMELLDERALVKLAGQAEEDLEQLVQSTN